jgi:hypothetical protein
MRAILEIISDQQIEVTIPIEIRLRCRAGIPTLARINEFGCRECSQ